MKEVHQDLEKFRIREEDIGNGEIFRKDDCGGKGCIR